MMKSRALPLHRRPAEAAYIPAGFVSRFVTRIRTWLGGSGGGGGVLPPPPTGGNYILLAPNSRLRSSPTDLVIHSPSS